MTNEVSPPTVLLIAGHWLGAWAWDEVVAELGASAETVVAMTLPGLDGDDPDRLSRTIDDQVEAILGALQEREVSAALPSVIVAHSGANGPVSVVLDRHPELVARVVWVDSGPMASGGAFAPAFPLEELALPPFDVIAQQASLEGLSPEVLERFRVREVPEPAGVLRQVVELCNEARHRVPTTLVCCSISGDQVMEMARAGHPMFADVALLSDVEVVDLPTGHWPMWSRPAELAALIRAAY